MEYIYNITMEYTNNITIEYIYNITMEYINNTTMEYITMESIKPYSQPKPYSAPNQLRDFSKLSPYFRPKISEVVNSNKDK